MLVSVRAIAAVGLGAMTILFALGQFAAVISAKRKGRRFSYVPFVGAILGVGACLVAPWQGSRWLVPIAFILDPTPLMFLSVMVKVLLRRDDR
jgi:hypothetical protein